MIKKLKPVVAAAATVLALNAHAAIDIFLDIEGPIAGESQDPEHKGEIDVLAWSWGQSNSGTTHIGGGSGPGKASYADVSVTKWVDSSSTVLMRHAANGGLFTKATLTLRTVGTFPLEFAQLAMYKVLVSSVSTGGSGGEDRLTENVTLNFESFCMRYTQQLLGGEAGTTREFCWNIAANEPCTVDQIATVLEISVAMSLPQKVLLAGNLSCPNSSSVGSRS